jgi:predicted transcriptional regulator
MDVVYQLGEASVAEVVTRLADQPGYNTVRNTMAILERKGYLEHRQDGPRYLYSPVGAIESAKGSAVSHLLDTFFGGSLPQAMQAMLGAPDRTLTRDDLDEIARLIEEAKNKVRPNK